MPPSPSDSAGGLVVGSLVLYSICLIPSSPHLLLGSGTEAGSEGEREVIINYANLIWL